MTEMLAENLEDDVIFGVYPPGSRITEDRVMERYGAKRHAVRGAFATLEARGLLLRQPNRGVEVVALTPDQVDELYDVRLVLETAAAERTRLPCDPALAARLEDIAGRHAAAVDAKDFRAVFQLNQQFHEAQYACCDSPRLAELIETHSRIAQPIRVVKYDDADHMRTVVEQHFAIIEAMRGTSTEALVGAVRAHLPASAEAYRLLYAHRFGAAAAGRDLMSA